MVVHELGKNNNDYHYYYCGVVEEEVEVEVEAEVLWMVKERLYEDNDDKNRNLQPTRKDFYCKCF